MKTRIALSILFALSSAHACGGKVIIDDPGEGGAGGAPSTTVDVGPGPMTSVGTGPVTTGTGDPTCITCAQVINGELGGICPGSNDLYNALVTCACNALCAPSCDPSLCKNNDASDACIACVEDNAMGCGKELAACTSDI